VKKRLKKTADANKVFNYTGFFWRGSKKKKTELTRKGQVKEGTHVNTGQIKPTVCRRKTSSRVERRKADTGEREADEREILAFPKESRQIKEGRNKNGKARTENEDKRTKIGLGKKVCD